MAHIQSGDDTTLWKIDEATKAGRMVAVGSSVTPVNTTKAPTTTSAELLAAAADDLTARTTLLRNIGTVTVYVAFGETATSSKFPIQSGETLRTRSLLAINGVTASGTGSLAVLSESY